jgi:hypothetical protein
MAAEARERGKFAGMIVAEVASSAAMFVPNRDASASSAGSRA